MRASGWLFIGAVATLTVGSSVGASSTSTLSFEGDYKRTKVTPSYCVQTDDCNYQCSASYSITVEGSQAYIQSTANPSDCTCYNFYATIDGSTATGEGSNSEFSLTRTESGVETVATVSGYTCNAIYTSVTSTSTSSGTTESMAVVNQVMSASAVGLLLVMTVGLML